MGKDREGRFHPKKGRPSGSKEEGLGLRPSMDPEQLEQDQKMTEKYTKGPDTLSENVHLLHPNRNTNKKRDYIQEADPDNPSDKTVTEKFKEEYTGTAPAEMLGIFSRDTFATLADFSSAICISFYLPTHRKGIEVNEQYDLIEYKNLLQDAEAALNKRKIEEIEIKKLLKPGYDLLGNDAFWHNLPQGLAFFIADGYFQYARLPFSPQKQMLIDKKFFISPLVEAMVEPEYFYLLVMSKKQVKFFRADKFGIEHLPVDELPAGIDDVVHFEEKDDQKLFRTGGSGAGGGANYHGIGAGKPDEKENVSLYLKEVDNTLWKSVLHNETAPLLLAGIEYMIPLYREVSHYKFIWPDAIAHGGLEREPDSALYDMAMKKMEPYFRQRLNDAMREYFNQSAKPLTSTLPSVIIPAAYYGRVKYLFVAKDEHIWGRFDEQNNLLFMDKEQKGDDDCLVDQSVIRTILNGGEAFLLTRENMPDQSTLAAVMRY